MLDTSNEYNDYLNSYEWKAIKAKKIEDNFNCECCWVPATTVHHLSYERLWKILETDLVSLCESCHHECHFINWEEISNDETSLRNRYKEVRDNKQKEWIKEISIEKELNVEDEECNDNEQNLEKIWKLYTDQYEAYNKIVDFLNSESDVFILKWAAWTGKTTLLKELKNYFVENNVNFFFWAPTWKATYVLKDKLNITNPDTYWTIYSVLYEINDSLDKWNKDVNYFQKVDLLDEYVYIIDESSLINYKNQLDNDEYQKNILNFWTGSLLKDIFSSKKSKNTKIIFVWDIYQLPPVNDQSRALDKNFLEEKFEVKCDEAELTEVKRQKWESWILDMSVKVRTDIKNDNYKIPFLKWNNDVILLNNEKEFLNIYWKNIDNSIIISYTNKKIYEYNNVIRKEINHFNKPIEIWDKIMISKNTFVWDEQFLNWEIVEVVNVHWNIEIKKDIFVNKIKNDLKFLDVTIKRDFGKEKYFQVKILLNSIDIDNWSWEDITLWKYLFSEFMNRTIYSEKNNPNWIWKITTKWWKTKYYKNIDNIDEENKEFLKIVMKEDRYLNSLEIKYWFAITCHKSQWSEWQNIFLNINDYSESQWIWAKISKGFFNYLYTWITRWKSKVYILNNDNLLEYWNYEDFSSKFLIEDEFINEYINKIWTVVKSYNYELENVEEKISIEEVIPKDYKVAFVFSNGKSKAYITVNYNKKYVFWKAQLHNKENPFTNNLWALLLKHNIIKDVY